MRSAKDCLSTFSACWLLFCLLGVPAALAEPSDPFTGSSPSFDTAPEDVDNANPGDWGVAEQRGAATYTYAITVPPGRNGMAPRLALRYSSQSPLRGGIAVGWTLDIPSVRRDDARGNETEKSYKATLGSLAGRLVEVPDASPYPGKAYRAEFDDGSFIRFFHSTPGEFEAGPRGWIALTPDGVRHFFEQERGASDNLTRWHITRQVDSFGNTVRYFWSEVRGPNGPQIIDYSLERIEYTSNEVAGLAAHAKVEFAYAPLEVCSFSNIPIGAQPLRRPGTVEGARRLTAIKTHVRDDPGGPWRLSKHIALQYELRSSVLHEALFAPDPPPPDMHCTQNLLRYLTQIEVTSRDRAANPTSLPPMTFEYNHRVNTTAPVPFFQPPALQAQTLDAPGFAHYGTTDGARGTLLDIDSDGIKDRVSVIEEAGLCTLVWQKGLLGGAFAAEHRKSSLPTVPWYEAWRGVTDPQLMSGAGLDEQCTLNGQVAYRDRPIIGGRVLAKGVVSYHFLDFTGDGRLDLLTNVWAEAHHSSYEPGAPLLGGGPVSGLILNNPDPLSNRFVPMTPEKQDVTRHVWRLYRNVGDPHALVFPSDPNAVFSTVPMNVISPRPLPPSRSDERLDPSILPHFSIPTLTDIDGDGFLDVIDVTRDNNILGRSHWTVYLGDGGPTFPELIDAMTWVVPRFDMAIAGNGFGEETSNCGLRFVRAKRTVAGLFDIDSNGLPDLVVQTDDLRLRAFRNTGSGFQTTSLALDLGMPQPLEHIQTDCVVPSVTVLKDGHRGYKRRLVDLDGDGRLDQIAFTGHGDDITAEHGVIARFNMGDRFGPRVQLPSEWLKAKRLLSAAAGDWHLETDFVDITGDGQPDLGSWDGGDTLTFIASPGLPQAPDLLRAFENGRGLRVEFSYAPTTDSDTVQWTPLVRGGPHLPSVMWVVREVTVHGGFDTPERTTRYAYGDPRYVSPSQHTGIPERSRFAGFGHVSTTVHETSGASARLVRRAYAYDQQGAPDGRAIKEWVYEASGEAFRLHKYKEIGWQRRSLFAGVAFFVHRDTTLTRACEPEVTEAACMAQTVNVHRVRETWVGVAPSQTDAGTMVTASAGGASELYIRTVRQEGSGLTESAGDRRTSYQYLVRYGQDGLEPDDYRIVTAQSTLTEATPQGTSLAFDERGRTRHHYDSLTGLPIRTDVWQSETTVATTKRTFDQQTGHLLSETEPAQVARGGAGARTLFAYDPHQLFVERTSNELGHEVVTSHDIATGVRVQQEGPNVKTLPAGEVVRELETWRLDGFGRILKHAISVDDDTAGYVAKVINKTTYFDFERPNRVQSERRLDLSGDVWITQDRKVDGLGRLLSDVVHVGAGQIATTTYEYDSTGNLAAIEVPNPSMDGLQARYEYHHDGLNRLTHFIRPDGSGVSTAYAGLQKTVREIAADSSGSTTKQVYDVFGRVIEVHEFDSTVGPAITRYRYDARDNLTEVIDAEGNVTGLTHDWTGNRVAVIRGPRTWRYTYDLNGNLVEEIAPHPVDADPALHTTAYEYDDLDRVITVGFADGQELKSIHHLYDSGPNATGRLSRVELPVGEIRYVYDARGLVISEERSFVLSDIASASISQSVQREYNALGLLTRSTWNDGQQWQITYDERGLVDTVEWHDQQAERWHEVANYTRTIAGQPHTRRSSFGQVRRFTYDELGRPTLDVVLRLGHPDGALFATRAYEYTDSGDLEGVSGTTNGIPVTGTFTYDSSHRLQTAAGSNGYRGAFTYSPTGNILTAEVTWNGSAETRNVRYEYGAQDPQAVDQLVNLADDETYAAFVYDVAGNILERSTPEGLWKIDWDGLGQIRRVQGPNGTEVYYYDHTGGRVLAVNESRGVRFWFAESETLYDLNGAQLQRYLHLSGHGPTLARVENGSTLELQYADALQNLMFSLDEDGNLAASFLYGAFGEIIHAIGEETHRRQFNGKEHDVVTRLRYYGHRYYDPVALRWLSADPLYRIVPDLGKTNPQRMNVYAFSLNNPMRYYDPDGWRPADETDPDQQICELPEPGTCELEDEEEDQEKETSDSERKKEVEFENEFARSYAEGLVEKYGPRAAEKAADALFLGLLSVSEWAKVAEVIELELNRPPEWHPAGGAREKTPLQRFQDNRQLLLRELEVGTGESIGAIITGTLRDTGVVSRRTAVGVGGTVSHVLTSTRKGLRLKSGAGKPHTLGAKPPTLPPLQRRAPVAEVR